MSDSKVGLFVLLGVLVLGVAALDYGYFTSSHQVADTSKVVASPAPIVSVDLSNVTAQIAAVQATVDKDPNWKTQAESLASAEWSKNGYRDIFNFLVDSSVTVAEKQDISSVTVVSESVSAFNSDTKDATIVQELKVRYDDNSGSERSYLDVTTVVKDGEVDTQDFEFH
jgi:hypothetical protein